MTNEEAIKILNDYDINFERNTAEEVAEAHEMAIKALETQPNEDCISRQAVLDALHRYFADGFDGDRWWNSTHVLDAINKVPSIQPQPKEEPQQKTGHWITLIDWGDVSEVVCSCCDAIGNHKWHYCPECGAKMQEVKNGHI